MPKSKNQSPREKSPPEIRSLRELLTILVSFGISPDTVVRSIRLGTATDANAAPIGKFTHWSNPNRLPALTGRFRGQLTEKQQRSRNCDWYPWDGHPLIHCRCANFFGDHEFDADLYIFCEDIPQVMKEWSAIHESLTQALQNEAHVRNDAKQAEEEALEQVRAKYLPLIRDAADRSSREHDMVRATMLKLL